MTTFHLAAPPTFLETDTEWWALALAPRLHHLPWRGASPEHARALRALTELFQEARLSARQADQGLEEALASGLPAAWLAEQAMEGFTDALNAIARRFGASWMAWERTRIPLFSWDSDAMDEDDTDAANKIFKSRNKNIETYPTLAHALLTNGSIQALDVALKHGWDPLQKMDASIDTSDRHENRPPTTSWTPLAWAIDGGKSIAIQRLLDEPRVIRDAESRDEGLFFLLRHLPENNSRAKILEWSKTLLAAGADINRTFILSFEQDHPTRRDRSLLGRCRSIAQDETSTAGLQMTQQVGFFKNMNSSLLDQLWVQCKPYLKPETWPQERPEQAQKTFHSCLETQTLESSAQRGEALSLLACRFKAAPSKIWASALRLATQENEFWPLGWFGNFTNSHLPINEAALFLQILVASALSTPIFPSNDVMERWATFMAPDDANRWRHTLNQLQTVMNDKDLPTSDRTKTVYQILELERILTPGLAAPRVRL